MALICDIIPILKYIPVALIILLIFLYDRWFMKNAHIYRTAAIICAFTVIMAGSAIAFVNLEKEYECRPIDKLKQKDINFTHKYYTTEEYFELETKCDGYPLFHTSTNRTIRYIENSTIEALECFPRLNKTNKIKVWGNCTIPYNYYKHFPKTWYICN